MKIQKRAKFFNKNIYKMSNIKADQSEKMSHSRGTLLHNPSQTFISGTFCLQKDHFRF